MKGEINLVTGCSTFVRKGTIILRNRNRQNGHTSRDFGHTRMDLSHPLGNSKSWRRERHTLPTARTTTLSERRS